MKTFSVRLSILLEPVGSPDVVITCGGQKTEIILTTPRSFYYEYAKQEGTDTLIIEHRNRHPHDGVTAVIVKSISMNGITHMQNTYQGIYYPHGHEARRDTYIGWNGIWILEFTVPVFTWMHRTQGFGWIYD